jgi:hypothetical protein
MERMSRTLLMSVGVFKNTLTASEQEQFETAQAAAEKDRELQLDEKIGFELGWDYARFLGWHPPDEKNKHFLGGFSTARSRTSSPSHLDRYTRKWLQLRYGAWKRNRVFDANVTPEFIQQIDRPMCPILGTPLTHSTGEPTDWSVDRLNNAGGYAVGNLAVMSTEANAAKGNLSLEDILELSRRVAPCSGLTPLEWKRMLSLLTGPYSVIQEKELLLPLCIVPPPFVPINLFQELQLILARETGLPKSGLIAKLQQICKSRGTVRQFKKVCERLRENQNFGRPFMEVWLQPATFEALLLFYEKLLPKELERMRVVIERALGCEQVSDDMRQRWSLESRGFS